MKLFLLFFILVPLAVFLRRKTCYSGRRGLASQDAKEIFLRLLDPTVVFSTEQQRVLQQMSEKVQNEHGYER